jgi:hypothetical protein
MAGCISLFAVADTRFPPVDRIPLSRETYHIFADDRHHPRLVTVVDGKSIL